MSYAHLKEDTQLRSVYALLRKRQSHDEAFALLQQMTSKHIGTSSHDEKTDQQIAIHIASAWTVLLGSCPVECFKRMLSACVCQIQAAIRTMTDPRRKKKFQDAFWFETRIDARVFLPNPEIRGDEKEQWRLLVVTPCLAVARQLSACIRYCLKTKFDTYSVTSQNFCVWKIAQQFVLIQRMFVLGKYRFECPHSSLLQPRKLCRVCEQDYEAVYEFVCKHTPRQKPAVRG